MTDQDKNVRKIHDPILPGERGSNFLAIEQKYIQAAYKLDRELSRFEELYNYSTELNAIQKDAFFLERFAESLVDLFDMENSALWLCEDNALKEAEPQILVTDGDIDFVWQDVADWCLDAGLLQSGSRAEDVALLTSQQQEPITGVRQMIAGRLLDKNRQIIAIALGYVSNRKAAFYNIDVVECKNSFKVYLGMVSMLWQNRTDQKHILFQVEELKKARDAAEQASRAKSQFLSNMSHELRTPLNAILGFAEVMKFNNALSEEDADNVVEITHAGNHLLQLINDILDLAKIEVGKIEFMLETVELDEIIAESMSLMLPLAQKKGLHVEYQQHTGYVLTVDKTRLKQCLLNLLSNAVKYNREQGSVSLVVDRVSEQRLRISITDTGKGIAGEDIELLFRPFERLNLENTGIEGTGIGLSITQRIVESMGGKTGVESEPGRGSTFWLEFPFDSCSVPDSSKNTRSKILAPEEEVQDRPRYRVIYIEDNPANIKLITRILSFRRDIELTCAALPKLGIELMQQNRPDLLLLDINLPGMSGFEILRLVRSHEETRDIPVLALSADAMPFQVQKGIDSGFSEYLTKPLNIDLFNETLKRYLPVIDS